MKNIKTITFIGEIEDPLNGNIDVEVEFDDSSRYVATFFTLVNIQYLIQKFKYVSGECNNGRYFWASDMCIVEVLDRKLIEETINTFLEEECFEAVFSKLKN